MGKLSCEIAAFSVDAGDDEPAGADVPRNLDHSSLLCAREHRVLARVTVDEQTA